MADNQNQNTFFEDDQPKIVHLNSNESHYEMCRMQMHDIEHVHRRTFLANMVLSILVCFLSIFHINIQCFSLLSAPFMVEDTPGMNLAGGIFQIIVAMIIIIAGYLAWANFHSLNLLLETWYAFVVILGVFRLDVVSAIIGVVGFAFYLFSIQAMRREESLSQLEGYPEFREKFDIDKSDIVIQTLLAHKGEKREKPSFFSAGRSLRRKQFVSDTAEQNGRATDALADELTKALRQKKLENEISAEDTAVSEQPADAAEEMESLETVLEDNAETVTEETAEIAEDIPTPEKTAETPAETKPSAEHSAPKKPSNQAKNKKKKH